MEKIDLKKDLKHLYQPSSKVIAQVDVPTMNYLMIDGEGNPNTVQAYKNAVEVLFMVSYAVKFMVKKQTTIDYTVMPLEGLWWVDDMSRFSVADKEHWQWTMMILQPDFVARETIERAISDVKKKKNPSAIDKLRFETFCEGKCAQILHVGPFSEEGPTIAKLHQFIDSSSQLTGKHHEIYLSDTRKANPAKWKTIIRQPMQ
jgi:hypothetical protein